MKKLTTIGLSILMSGSISSVSFANIEAKTDLKTKNNDTNKSSLIADTSYTIGYQIGANMIGQLKSQGIKLDNAKLINAFTEAVNGEKPELSPKQMQEAMMMFQKQIEEQKKDLDAKHQIKTDNNVETQVKTNTDNNAAK